jgi:tRNA(His) 5'-end guanylyltransferase
MRKIPVIIRLDGKAFHGFTKRFDRPFSSIFAGLMAKTALRLCKEIQGATCAYTQSDEISILVSDLDSLKTEAWFGYNLQKVVSISASIATAEFNYHYLSSKLHTHDLENMPVFDSRAFNIPAHEVVNYFIWRQNDWNRNSLQMIARKYFTDSQLYMKKKDEIHDMLYSKEVNWAELPDWCKNGYFIDRGDPNTRHWTVRPLCPIFTRERGVIESQIKSPQPPERLQEETE